MSKRMSVCEHCTWEISNKGTILGMSFFDVYQFVY